jgi:hypothetical protein
VQYNPAVAADDRLNRIVMLKNETADWNENLGFWKDQVDDGFS